MAARRRAPGRLEPKGLQRGREVRMTVDGQPCQAFLGETVAAALMAADRLEFRSTCHGSARGLFCGMGVCFDCVMIVDSIPNTRTCMTWVADGMTVERQVGPGVPYPHS